MKKLIVFVLIAAFLFSGVGLAFGQADAGPASVFPLGEPLSISVTATRVTSDVTAEVEFALKAAPMHYFYSDKLTVAVKSPDGVALAELVKPKPKMKDVLGEQVGIYEGTTHFTARLQTPSADALKETDVLLQVGYEGCSDTACFRPAVRVLTVRLGGLAAAANVAEDEPPAVGASHPQRLYGVGNPPTVIFTRPDGTEYAGERINGYVRADAMREALERVASNNARLEAQSSVSRWIAEKGLLLTLAVVFAGGLALTFTPCVWPMIPITAGIVLGAKKPGTGAGLLLSSMYVLGLALAYSLLGLITASAGGAIGASLQHPYVIGGVVVLFTAMAMAMFGVYEMPMVSLGAGRFHGGGAMACLGLGAVSALVMSPCVGPLAAALLTFVAGSGNRLLGMLLLFVFGFGMGVPLIVIGTFSGSMKRLPKSGPWMVEVRKVIGLVLIAFAIHFMFPLVGYRGQWYAAGAAAILLGVAFIVFDARHALGTMFGKLKAAACVAAIAAGVAAVAMPPVSTPPAGGIRWYNSLEEGKAAAIRQNKPMMIDFTADWCVMCRELDAYTFSDAAVIRAAQSVVPVKIDLSNK